MCKFGRLTLRSSRKPTLGLKSQKEVLNSLEKKLTCILAYLRFRFKHVLSVRLLTFLLFTGTFWSITTDFVTSTVLREHLQTVFVKFLLS